MGLHATDPATPFLSAWARVPGFAVADLEDALYDTARLTKRLGMRRTLFVVSDAVWPVVQAACTDRILVRERNRLVVAVERAGVAADGRRWLRRAEAATLAALAERGPSTGAQLSRAVPELQAKVSYSEGSRWGGPVGVTTRLLTILAAHGRIRRGRPVSWTSSQHRWELTAEAAPRLPEAEGRRELVRRWLAGFGPGTLADLTWWTGLGVTAIRQALAGLDTVEVDLDGEVGVVLAGDEEPEPEPDPWVALLPPLDTTVMGWKGRDWYLGEHGRLLFDRSGNAGPTVWCDGRVVGGWAQRPSGEVVHRLLDDVGAEARARVDAAAEDLSRWLAGTVVVSRFPSPLDRELRG